MRLLVKQAAAEAFQSVPWSLSRAAYTNVSFSVAAPIGSPEDIAFKSDGTKMYVVGSAEDKVFQYSLSTAWNLSTASYDSVSFSVEEEITPKGISFKSDGTKMYVVGSANDKVYQYSLSTAWDLSTASYDSVSFSVATEETTPQALAFKSDGTKMYVVGVVQGKVFQYSLSTAWDLSTASYDSVSFSLAAQAEPTPPGLSFKSDGTKMYVVGSAEDKVFQYSLSTAWNLSTASYDSVSFSVAGQDSAPTGLAFKSNGTRMYVVGNGSDTIYQYSL